VNVFHDKHVFSTLLEDETLDVQEEDGHNNSFSFGAGHNSIPELADNKN
jgi:hypothetical protein